MIKKTKFNKESRNLLIAMTIGDGTIMKGKYSCSMKLEQGRNQEEYLKWKIKKLDEFGIKHSDIKVSYNKTNYTHGEYWTTYRTYIKHTTFIEVLRKVIYTPIGKVLSRKLLNRLTPLGLAIWYMDDGGLNHKKKTNLKGQRIIYSTALRLSVCTTSIEVIQSYINYFREVWNINFYTFKEGKNRDKYSLMCGTKEARKFLDIVGKYVSEVKGMEYKNDLLIGHICDSTEKGNGEH